MFLHNDLAEGRFRVEGRPIAISAMREPIFAVSTETDHVAPWHSVYKIHLLNEGDITFVLTSGGHNAGIVSEPGHPRRHYRIEHRPAQGEFIAPEDWMAAATEHEGSWWVDWVAWLNARSGSRQRHRLWLLLTRATPRSPMRRVAMCVRPESKERPPCRASSRPRPIG